MKGPFRVGVARGANQGKISRGHKHLYSSFSARAKRWSGESTHLPSRTPGSVRGRLNGRFTKA
eukprot:2195150-Alexandrium_andersonii.AAC.1